MDITCYIACLTQLHENEDAITLGRISTYVFSSPQFKISFYLKKYFSFHFCQTFQIFSCVKHEYQETMEISHIISGNFPRIFPEVSLNLPDWSSSIIHQVAKGSEVTFKARVVSEKNNVLILDCEASVGEKLVAKGKAIKSLVYVSGQLAKGKNISR